ncbi:Polysaccharide deacetylase [uncultured Candidatus Thioglobus sp.]|nr:Polysaccharide deacetylase [uncultured Candidatus Thioglobus sp.]
MLQYHHFSDTTPKSTSISPALFEQHLHYLKENNFKVLKLATMLKRLNEGNLPDKCVVLTADDGYQSIAKNAYPLLRKYQMPMSVFIASKPADKKYPVMMSWEKMRDIQGDIVQFYNHGIDHSYFLKLDKAQIQAQINQAQNRLNKELNQEREKILAYPYGEVSLPILQQVKKLGYTAFGQYSGVVSKSSNQQYLPRFPMAAHYAKMPSFKTKVNTLPMPIKAQNINPIFEKNPPTLTLEFTQPLNKHQKANLQCFANGGVNMIWQGNQKVEITAKKKLSQRRSKYNCTLPSEQKGRYHWHSVQWIKR